MSHTTLYRKYRPSNFGEILGQEEIVNSLKSTVATGKPAHAYMFAGSRGTGKTSTARVFAQSLGIDPVDIHEIDAASQRRVEDMREFITEVSTRPMISPFKVYIFDEVHMLTRESANTFLKTLEEPPSHVIFILATTDLDKVLDTIISRCQVYIFKQPSVSVISQMLIQGAEKEGFILDTSAAELIAHSARGAFRDAWGILERVITTLDTKQEITEQIVQNILGNSHQSSQLVLQYLHDGKLAEILGIIHELESSGGDINLFVERVVHLIRVIMMMRFAPAVAEQMTLYMDNEMRVQLQTYADEPKNIFNSQTLLRLLSALSQMTVGNSFLIAELAFIDILSKLDQ